MGWLYTSPIETHHQHHDPVASIMASSAHGWKPLEQWEKLLVISIGSKWAIIILTKSWGSAIPFAFHLFSTAREPHHRSPAIDSTAHVVDIKLFVVASNSWCQGRRSAAGYGCISIWEESPNESERIKTPGCTAAASCCGVQTLRQQKSSK